jgi:hypothetical protein
MLGEQLCDVVRGRARPVSPKFGHVGERGKQLRPSLDHALDAALMTFGAAATSEHFLFPAAHWSGSLLDFLSLAQQGEQARHDRQRRWRLFPILVKALAMERSHFVRRGGF